MNLEKGENLMKLFEKKENCCGCAACFSICPKQAITMISDDEGFLYPIIDISKCVKCNKCLQICGFKMHQKERFDG